MSSTEQVEILSAQLKTARSEINNLRQQIKSLTHAHRKDCDEIQQKLANWRCLECRKQNGETDEELQNISDLPLNYIGQISTHFPEKRGTPRQPGICADMIAKLSLNTETFTNPEHALEGLQEFSHIWILYHFHRNDSTHVRAKVAPPRLNGFRTGVFATRSPHRPSPIGLSLVRITRIVDNTIYFSGVDMIDGTPVLDIKPYIPQYDNPSYSHSNTTTDTQSNNASTANDSMPTVSGSTLELASLAIESSMAMDDVDGLRLDVSGVSETEGASSGVSDSMSSVDATRHLGLATRVLDGDENGAVVSSVLGRSSNVEEVYYNRSTSRIGEREAPDGEEEESPVTQTPSGASGDNQTQIRVPSWIDNPPVSTLTVHFKDAALLQLNQLGTEAEDKKAVITNVLREDPRSVYLRERLGSHCYVFRIADLNVSCRFNDALHAVTVFKVFPNTENSEL